MSELTQEQAQAVVEQVQAEIAAIGAATPPIPETPPTTPPPPPPVDAEKERFNELLMAGVQAAEKGETIYCLQITQEQRLVGDYYLLKRKDAQDFLNYMGGKLKNIGALVIKGKRLNPRVEHKVYL